MSSDIEQEIIREQAEQIEELQSELVQVYDELYHQKLSLFGGFL